MRRLWRLPWITHCCFLPHIVGCMSPELWFAKRCIKFINMAVNSRNYTVKTISNMGLFGSHSIMGSNYKYLQSRFKMCQGHVSKRWDDICKDEAETIRIAEQTKEVVEMRDKCVSGVLSKNECKVVWFLCLLLFKHVLFLYCAFLNANKEPTTTTTTTTTSTTTTTTTTTTTGAYYRGIYAMYRKLRHCIMNDYLRIGKADMSWLPI